MYVGSLSSLLQWTTYYCNGIEDLINCYLLMIYYEPIVPIVYYNW